MNFNFSQYFLLFKTHSLLLSLFISSSYSNVSYQNLPPPENPVFARQQLYLNPFRTTLDQALTCGQLIASRGFQYERHFVITKDNYILQLYRIRNPYAIKARGRKLKPILLLHGGAVSCSSYMINGPGGHIKVWVNGNPPNDTSLSLAFALANIEFDLWIGNFRGTTYSMNHTRLDPHKDPEYWNFSFTEMGKYDVPAMIDYVILKTGHQKIVWIGYSQGTIAMLTFLSKQPEYACKLDLNINVSPIAFYADRQGIASIVPESILLSRIGLLYSGPVFPVAELDALLSILCTDPALMPICYEIYNYGFGPDRPMVSPEQIKVLVSQIDQESFKSGLHVVQSFKYDQLHEFDYGPEKNLIIYNSTKAPAFPFENVPTFNLVLISGQNDYLAPPTSLQKLRNILKDRAFIDHIVKWPLWAHGDILLAKDAFYYLHSVIIDIIRRYGEDVPTDI